VDNHHQHLLDDTDLIIDTLDHQLGMHPQHRAASGGNIDVMQLLIVDGLFDLRFTD
jgi:hypothetical protein